MHVGAQDTHASTTAHALQCVPKALQKLLEMGLCRCNTAVKRIMDGFSSLKADKTMKGISALSLVILMLL